MWHNNLMTRLSAGALAVLLVCLAGSALAEALPRLERERCAFKPPRSDRLECYVLVVPENREKPSGREVGGREVRLQLVVLKAKRKLDADPMVYLAGGPGDAPLVASNSGADALSEGDWWNDTANIRKRRDVIILSQRGAGGSTPNLDCFEARISEAARARRRAITEAQERDILVRCRSEIDRQQIDLAMYTTPILADDVADMARAFSFGKINLYGISYGTRWALEVMRRHSGIVRSAVLDAVYPPQVNGEQHEPDIVRAAFEQLIADCTTDPFCRQRHPQFSTALKALVEGAQRTPLAITLQLDDGPQGALLDGTKIMMVLLHMMREGEAALIPEAVAGLRRGGSTLFRQFAEDFENHEGGLLEQNAQQFVGLFNTIECRESWSAVDQAARQKSILKGGIYGLTAKISKLPVFCPAWRVPPAPPAERQPVRADMPTLLLSGGYDWLTPASWGKIAAQNLSMARHIVFRSQGHGVSSQDPCAARLRDEFLVTPDPGIVPDCPTAAPLDFAAAADRVKSIP
jgi:pimeloyl-ACP methyl ester carboxylesterase